MLLRIHSFDPSSCTCTLCVSTNVFLELRTSILQEWDAYMLVCLFSLTFYSLGILYLVLGVIFLANSLLQKYVFHIISKFSLDAVPLLFLMILWNLVIDEHPFCWTQRTPLSSTRRARPLWPEERSLPSRMSLLKTRFLLFQLIISLNCSSEFVHIYILYNDWWEYINYMLNFNFYAFFFNSVIYGSDLFFNRCCCWDW